MGESPQDTVRSLVRFYEHHGALILKLYAEAHQAPGVPELAARGRRYHVAWCCEAFSGALEPDLDPATRARRLAQVVALCDATTWRVLRVDGGLSPEETEEAVLELLVPLLSDTTQK